MHEILTCYPLASSILLLVVVEDEALALLLKPL